MMTDSEDALNDKDLVELLRSDYAEDFADQAADRIEELVATNEQLLKRNETLERELEAVYYDISMNAGET
jgi:cell division septum initiation protein DivIVA